MFVTMFRYQSTHDVMCLLYQRLESQKAYSEMLYHDGNVVNVLPYDCRVNQLTPEATEKSLNCQP